jgi:hypothetical protein
VSRYVNEITTSKNADEVERTVSEFCAREGFHKQVRDHEEVWVKGSGMLVARQFVKAAPVDGHVHIEAWIKPLFTGESGIEGTFGAVPKRKLKERVLELEHLLS